METFRIYLERLRDCKKELLNPLNIDDTFLLTVDLDLLLLVPDFFFC